MKTQDGFTYTKMRYLIIILIATFLSSCNSPKPKMSLVERFTQPEDKYKPGLWWWWNGNALTKEEINRQLNSFEKVGISVSIRRSHLSKLIHSG